MCACIPLYIGIPMLCCHRSVVYVGLAATLARAAGNAPVSKAVLVATAAASVITQAARASHKRVPLALQLLSRAFVFRTQGELLFGCILLYHFRVHERQHGSSKYGACVCAITGIAYILQLALTKVLGSSTQLSTGPFAIIFAGIIQFAMDIPATSRFTVLGIRMNDKVSMCLASLAGYAY
jgi:hypothetical protein